MPYITTQSPFSIRSKYTVASRYRWSNLVKEINSTSIKNILIYFQIEKHYSASTLLEPIRNSVDLNVSKTIKSCSSRSEKIFSQQDSSHELFNPTSSLDPFNDMELKTINDLEELKTILQNHQPTQQQLTVNPNEIDSSAGKSLPQLENFGLPNVSFIDLDINSNQI